MAITHLTVKIAGQRVFAVADWNAAHTGTLDHGTELTNVTPDQHHAKQHAIDSSADHTSTIVQNNLIDADVNGLPDDSGLTVANTSDAIAKKHDKQHAITSAADHTSGATPGQILEADANGLPVDATNTDAQVSATVTASHAKQHAIDSAVDHTSTIVQNNLMDADANGLPDDSGLTVGNTSDAIAKKHTQNTDTALGTGCVADDHGAAATDMVVNVCYGVGAPPAAATTTEGALFLKYTP